MAPIQAPLQIEEQDGRHLVVAFGKERPATRMLSETERVTVVGTFGTAQARLTDTKRMCDETCRDSTQYGDTCHWVGLYRLDAEVEGDAWAALRGTPNTKVETFTETEGPAPARTWTDPEFQKPIYPPPAAETPGYRWSKQPDGSALLEISVRGDVVPTDFALSTCSVLSVLGFERVECGDAVLLYRRDRLLLANIFMEAGNAADPLALVNVAGRRAYLVRYGLKYQKVMGLLVPDGEEWGFLVQPPDYSVSCPGA